MNIDPTILAQRCDNMNKGAEEAIDWIGDARNKSERLDREADDLVREFRRFKNKTARLSNAAKRPVSVGFFGLSQAGKSFLISSLAVNKDGELETEMDGKRVNFISHINPPGGGIAESTGLVTRFTRQKLNSPNGFPVALTLFSETDIIKILGNSYFNDFDPQKVTFNIDRAKIRSLLDGLQSSRQATPVAGISKDDVVDLMDYYCDNFSKSMEPFMAEYWPEAIELAPYLTASARATLFEALWGEVSILTQLYLDLRKALDVVGHAPLIHVPMSALVQIHDNGDYSQADSIINVAMMDRLGNDESDQLALVPDIDGEHQGQTSLARSMIAALTVEMRFHLVDTPRAEVLERIDLLDFPGYRGRMNVGNVDEIAKEVEDEDANPVKELLLRGKVAYLFELYSANQEMNALMLCTASNQQINITALGPVLEKWIESTQGETPDIRSARPPGLIWCITKFDAHLAPRPSPTKDIIQLAHAGMMKGVLLEKFGKYPWVQEWSNNTPFNNMFLVRKPKMAEAVIQTDDMERGIIEKYAPYLHDMREEFIAETTVQKHISSPAEKWDAMMTLNDGGMSYLAAYLEKSAKPDAKLARIQEQINALSESVIQRYLGSYHHAGGDEEAAQKKAIAKTTGDALLKSAGRLGEIINLLQVNMDDLRALYLQSDNDSERTGDDKDHDDDEFDEFDDDINALIDLPLDVQVEAAPTNSKSRRFADVAITNWITHVRRLPRNHLCLRYLRMKEDDLQGIVDELVTGVFRFKLEDKIVVALSDSESQTSATRADLVDRQILSVKRVFDDYLSLLGQNILPDDERVVRDGTVNAEGFVFAPPTAVPLGAVPQLPEQQIKFSAIFILDWVAAYRALVVDNAGQDAGREITVEQNIRLGEIIQQFT